MGDWYMEDGKYHSHYGDMVWDDNNSAYVEMGSSPESTPVWWRAYRGGPPDAFGESEGCQVNGESVAAYGRIRELETEIEKLKKEKLEQEGKAALFTLCGMGFMACISLFLMVGLLSKQWFNSPSIFLLILSAAMFLGLVYAEVLSGNAKKYQDEIYSKECEIREIKKKIIGRHK